MATTTTEKIENARNKVDESIDEWLMANGCTIDEIHDLDYSQLDNELNGLLSYIKGV